MTAIPRIIHQTWKDENVPHHIYDRRWVQSWTHHHPDWLYVLWTDARLRELGRACYPPYEVLYGSSVPGIYLADFGRYLVLHHFGGLYVDLDYECFKSLGPLLNGHDFVTSYTDETTEELNNALIASIPRHRLTRIYMDSCLERWNDAVRLDRIGELGPGPITGPDMMTEVTKAAPSETRQGMKVHEAALLCPVDWRKGLSIHRKTLPPEIIRTVPEEYPQAYAATYWTHVRNEPEI